MATLLACSIACVRGQSALDGFDPNANGQVNVVVVQPDGKILIAGNFTTVSPNGGSAVTRNHIARLNPDGTLDTAFDPNAGGFVNSIAIQADGKILAGGLFATIGGQSRNNIARLDATTGLADLSFDPNANDRVRSIAVQQDGRILVGGDFNGASSIGGQLRNRIARLDPNTGSADSFDPNADNSVQTIVAQGDGRILVGGDFTTLSPNGGLAVTRNRIARLNALGLPDTFNPNANGQVRGIAMQADGRILVGGNFSGANSIGGQGRNFMARLDANTGLADSWTPFPDGSVIAIVAQADGKILAGGSFTGIGGQSRRAIARLDPVTAFADSFDPKGSSFVLAIAVQQDGKILAGGLFASFSPNGGPAVTRNAIARLETDGRLDRTLDLSTVGSFVLATAVQPDGKILIGGAFSNVLGVARNNIARLNTDGTLDTAFDPNANATVRAITVQTDGKILAGGDFNGASSIGGQPRNRIARLDPITGAADGFDPNADSFVPSIALQADGKILVGGGFTNIGGQPRNFIARLDPTSALADLSFNPNANGSVRAITVQTDSKILVGGDFNGANSVGGATRNFIARLDPATGLADSLFDPNANNVVRVITVQADGRVLAGGDFNGANSIGGQPRNRIARLNATTGAADSFDPNANNQVLSMAVQADGRILVAGSFFGASSIGGQLRNRIARLDANLGAADSLDPNANNSVLAIGLQADGKILAGGSFTGAGSIGGQTRSLFARLTNDTASLPNLGATQTLISWTRGGSSPQFARVTFEYSADNVTYTSLGNVPAVGSNWTLTGLSLPIGQSFYIRARGYYGSGQRNGSESLAETVRYAFPAAFAITRNGNDIIVTYDAFANRTYRLERKLTFTAATWDPIAGLNDQTPIANGRAQITHPGGANQTKAFYRVSLLP